MNKKELTNNNTRSEIWEKIYKIISQIPRKECDYDAVDASSATTSVEKLFSDLCKENEELKKYVLPEFKQYVEVLEKFKNTCEIQEKRIEELEEQLKNSIPKHAIG